jgi:membrane protein implicated in regulation of membrane protease activity
MKNLLKTILFIFVATILFVILFPVLWRVLGAIIIFFLILLAVAAIAIAIFIWRIRRRLDEQSRNGMDGFTTYTFMKGQPQDFDDAPTGRRDVTPPDDKN